MGGGGLSAFLTFLKMLHVIVEAKHHLCGINKMKLPRTVTMKSDCLNWPTGNLQQTRQREIKLHKKKTTSNETAASSSTVLLAAVSFEVFLWSFISLCCWLSCLANSA